MTQASEQNTKPAISKKELLFLADIVKWTAGVSFVVTFIIGAFETASESEILNYLVSEMQDKPESLLYILVTLEEQGFSHQFIGLMILAVSSVLFAGYASADTYKRTHTTKA